MGRMFTHPETTKKKVHPYEKESKRLKLVANHFGQRVTGLTPIVNKLFVGTSSKGQGVWKPGYNFLNASQKAEYGAVAELTMNGNLVVPLRWTGKPTRLAFELTKQRMHVKQDGRTVATLSAQHVPLEQIHSGMTNWGDGLFGKLNGRLISRQ